MPCNLQGYRFGEMDTTNRTNSTSSIRRASKIAATNDKIHKAIISKSEKRDNKTSQLKDEYIRLTNRFERALIEHKLAVEYFEFRSFWFDFLPVTIIAALITVIGFFISGKTPEMNDGDQAQNSIEFDPVLTGHSKQFWSVAVGVLGVVSTLLNSIGKRTNYQSKYDMHRAAVKALEKICLTVEFEREWFKRKRNAEDTDVNDLGADLKSHQASFKAMQDACCESPIPTRIIQAFTVLDEVAGVEETGEAFIFYYHKLWKEHSMYWLWPLRAPSFDINDMISGWQDQLLQRVTKNNNNELRRVRSTGSVVDAINEEAVVVEHDSSDEAERPLVTKTSSSSYGATPESE